MAGTSRVTARSLQVTIEQTDLKKALFMVAKKLNNRQIATLFWISQRCPSDINPPASYKASARMLEGHGLVKVSGHGDSWNATITERGVRVLNEEEPLWQPKDSIVGQNTWKPSYAQKQPPKTPDPRPFQYTISQSPALRITTSFSKRQFIVTTNGVERRAAFPKQREHWMLVKWADFISVVSAVTHRTLGGVEGHDQWWLLDIPLSKFIDVPVRDTPTYSLSLLEEMPEGWDTIDKYLYWKCDHHGWRDGFGYYPGVGPDARGWTKTTGIVADLDLDLFRSLEHSLDTARRDGYIPQGKWIGRIVTGPENGQFLMELKVPTKFKQPQLPEPEWL